MSGACVGAWAGLSSRESWTSYTSWPTSRYGALAPDSPAYVPPLTFEWDSPHALSRTGASTSRARSREGRSRRDMRRGSLPGGDCHAPAAILVALDDRAQPPHRALGLAP